VKSLTKCKNHQKTVAVPAGSRQIRVDETKPTKNFLALSAADGKTFYFNGDHNIAADGTNKNRWISQCVF
jgi:hypothetical protein